MKIIILSLSLTFLTLSLASQVRKNIRFVYSNSALQIKSTDCSGYWNESSNTVMNNGQIVFLKPFNATAEFNYTNLNAIIALNNPQLIQDFFINNPPKKIGLTSMLNSYSGRSILTNLSMGNITLLFAPGNSTGQKYYIVHRNIPSGQNSKIAYLTINTP